MTIRKKNKIKGRVNGWIILEDNWLTEHDTELKDENGKKYTVLASKIIEETHNMYPDLIKFGIDLSRKYKYRCVRLNKQPGEGALLYSEYPIYK